MNSRAKRQYLTANVNGAIRQLQVDEAEGLSNLRRIPSHAAPGV